MARDWDKLEIEEAVESYIAMLRNELNGVTYNKTEFRTALSPKLNNRNKGSIEFKHQNISAILTSHDYPHIAGYKPLFSYQKLLREIVVTKAHKHNLPRLTNGFPFSQDSWKISSHQTCFKQMDKSSFVHNGTGIPKQLTFFFGTNATTPKREITLRHKDDAYKAVLQPDVREDRVRLLWFADFSQLISNTFPLIAELYETGRAPEHKPLLHFTQTEELDVYTVAFSSSEPVANATESIQDDFPEESIIRFEGETFIHLSTASKRSQANRKAAIKHHGLTCKVCGFNFENVYGEAGKGFIEVHHVTPLHESRIPQPVNPKKDLIPVCANCHRVIHKSGYTVEELSNILKRK